MAEHPSDMRGSLPDELVLTIIAMLEISPDQYVRSLLNRIKMLVKIAADCAVEDATILTNLDSESKAVLKDKKLATMAKLHEMMTVNVGFADQHIIRDIKEGFVITGQQSFSHAFDHQVLVPQTTVETLRSNSNFSNDTLLTKVKSSGSADVDKEFWSQQMVECENGGGCPALSVLLTSCNNT